MHRKILIATTVACLALVGTATAAQAPTLGAATTFKAGQKAPVDIAGNDLHHGQAIRKGTRLLRWKVTMHGASNASVKLTCPSGSTHAGLGLNDHPKVAFALAKGATYGHRTIKVRFYVTTKGTDADGATGHAYALCKTT